MEVLSAIDLANASLASAVGIYQLWFFARRPEHRAALWAGIIAIATAGYALCQVLIYEAEDPERARSAFMMASFPLAVMVHGVPAFAAALVGRKIPGWHIFAPLSIVFWTSLAVGTELMFPRLVEPVELTLLSHPYLQTPATVVISIFYLYCVAMACLGVWWLVRARKKNQPKEIFFLVGFTFWIAAGIHDILTAMRLFGTPMYLMEHGFLAFVLAIFARSVREHADALDRQERALEASELSFHQLIEQSPEMIAVHRSGRFVYVNPKGAQYLGFDSPKELIGTRVLDIIHPDDHAEVIARIEEMRDGLPTAPVEERLLSKDGTVLSAEVITIPIRFKDRPGFLMMGRDLTERVKLEARMMQLDRMVSIGTLAAGVAHEINNPLTFVVGNISTLQHDMNDFERILAENDDSANWQSIRDQLSVTATSMRSCLDDAKIGGDRIRTIVRELSGLARNKVREQRPIVLRDVVDPALKFASNEVKHRAQLVRDFEPTEKVLADSSKLCQVALNLIINAAQSIPLGHASENEIQVRTKMYRGQVALEVKDSGCGISEAQKDRIFEPFVTTKPSGQGVGLGLAICRRIVHDHGGEIEVESEVGKGSTFRVLLPPAETKHDRPRTRQSQQSPSSRKRGRVLVVDDEPMVVRSIHRTLAPDHDVEGVTTAAEALKKVAESPDYHLILCDLMMPEMSGMDFIETLEREYPKMAARTVLTTGGAFGPEARDFVSRLETPPLMKPFDVEQLRRLVRSQVDSAE